jgi:hypothetical protein
VTVHRPFSFESDEDMTLVDLEKFCRDARAAGATGDDHLRARVSFRGGIRSLRLKIELGHNRESAYRSDQGAKQTKDAGGHA